MLWPPILAAGPGVSERAAAGYFAKPDDFIILWLKQVPSRNPGANRNAIAAAVLASLWQTDGHELSIADLRNATAETRARYGGTHRFAGALAALERADIIW